MLKRINKNIFVFLIFIMTIFLGIGNIKAQEQVNLYFFHGDGCPHCSSEEVFLDSLQDKYPKLNVIKYEVWYNKNNSDLMNKVKKAMHITSNGVPLTIVGNKYIDGYLESFNSEIEDAIKTNGNKDVVRDIKNGTYNHKNYEKELKDKDKTFTLPILGKVKAKDASIPLLAVVIGFIDGFNPCAMWVLLFLISILIGIKDNKRMITLGSIFLITSALFYLFLMMSWLQIIIGVSTIIWIRNIIAVVAIIGAGININSYLKTNSNGCSVVGEVKRNKIFTKIKKFTSEKSLILAIIGVIGLAVSVNLVELVCSAGLPIVFTQILAINNITGGMAFFYTLLYVFFFLIDDIVIFLIAMITLEVTGVTSKYNKYSHLIGGIIMLVVGLLLLFKPAWLMFNF